MNRPYSYRGRVIPGVYQRCTARCGADRCDRHKWQYEVELLNAKGERDRATKGGFGTAKEANEARLEVIRLHKEGTLAEDRKMTLAQWLPRWLDARVERGELRPDVVDDYRANIDRFIIPTLGHMKLADIRGHHITAAYARLRRERKEAIEAAQAINEERRREAAEKNKVKHSGRPRVPKLVPVPRQLGPFTIRRIHFTLSPALKSAVKGGLIPRNPAPDAEFASAVSPKIKVWTADQLGGFLDLIMRERLYALYSLAVFAGMRRGELCGISWDDVDLERGRLTVRWQITEKAYWRARAVERNGGRGRYRSRPKTRAGEDRIVDLDTGSVAVLTAWKTQQAEEAEAWGADYVLPEDDHGPYNLVFTRENGAPLCPSSTWATFVKLVEKSGLTYMKLHGLRHMNISLLLEAGVSETVIAMRVGHTSPSLIRSTYGHLIGTVGKRAAEASASLVPRQATGEIAPAAEPGRKLRKAKKDKKTKKVKPPRPKAAGDVQEPLPGANAA